MRRARLYLTALLLAGAGCSAGGSDVTMSDELGYRPTTLTVAAGTTVTWTNEGDIAHSVTADQSSLPEGASYFSSGGAYATEEQAREHLRDTFLTQGESFSVTFDVPGTYEYYCLPHEDQGMRGEIIVEE